MADTTVELKIILKAIDQASQVLKQINGEVAALEKRAGAVQARTASAKPKLDDKTRQVLADEAEEMRVGQRAIRKILSQERAQQARDERDFEREVSASKAAWRAADIFAIRKAVRQADAEYRQQQTNARKIAADANRVMDQMDKERWGAGVFEMRKYFRELDAGYRNQEKRLADVARAEQRWANQRQREMWMRRRELSDLATAMQQAGMVGLGIGAGIAGGGVAVAKFGMTLNELEKRTIGSLAMTYATQRDANNKPIPNWKRARDIYNQMRTFGIESPFSVAESVASGRQLLTGGQVAPERILEVLNAVGNAAALGGRGQQGFNSLSIAIQRMRTQGVFSRREARMIAGAGVDPWKVLQDEFHMSQSELGRAITARQIGGVRASEAFIRAWGGGDPRYFAQMVKQMDTVEGKLSILRESFQAFVADLNKPFYNKVLQALDWLATKADALFRWWSRLQKEHGHLATAITWVASTVLFLDIAVGGLIAALSSLALAIAPIIMTLAMLPTAGKGFVLLVGYVRDLAAAVALAREAFVAWRFANLVLVPIRAVLLPVRLLWGLITVLSTAIWGFVAANWEIIAVVLVVVAVVYLLYRAFGGLGQTWQHVSDAFSGMWRSFAAAIPNIMGMMLNFVGKLLQVLSPVTMFRNAGRALLTAFGRGIFEGLKMAMDPIAAMFGWIGDRLPHSDAKKGPLSTLTRAGRATPETFAKGMRQGEGAVAREGKGFLDRVRGVVGSIWGEPWNDYAPRYRAQVRSNAQSDPVWRAMHGVFGFLHLLPAPSVAGVPGAAASAGRALHAGRVPVPPSAPFFGAGSGWGWGMGAGVAAGSPGATFVAPPMPSVTTPLHAGRIPVPSVAGGRPRYRIYPPPGVGSGAPHSSLRTPQTVWRNLYGSLLLPLPNYPEPMTLMQTPAGHSPGMVIRGQSYNTAWITAEQVNENEFTIHIRTDGGDVKLAREFRKARQ